MFFFNKFDKSIFKPQLQKLNSLVRDSFFVKNSGIFLKVFFAFLFTFFLFEIVLRVSFNFLPKVRYFLYSSRYDLNFSKINNHKDLIKNEPCPLIPFTSVNGFVINKNGYYTQNYSLEKDKNVVRIGFIGDSFTVGVVPYPDNFINVFQNLIKDNIKNKKVEVINWGVPCIGSRFEEKILEIDGYKTKPDYLVWMFFVGNDFTDEYFSENLGLGNKLTKNILTFRLIRNLQKSIQGISLNKQVPTDNKIYKESGIYVGLSYPYDDQKPTFTKEKYIVLQTEKLDIFNEEKFPKESLKSIKETFKSFSENCRFNSIKCLIVIIPDEIQVSRELLDQVIDNTKVKSDSLVMDLPQQKLAEFFKENNINYLDLLPYFPKEETFAKLYRPFDSHWNILGNKLAGIVIANYFLKMK